MTRVLLILLRHLEAHLLDAPMVRPVHITLFADQRQGRGLLGQGWITGPSRGGLCDSGQQPVGAKIMNLKRPMASLTFMEAPGKALTSGLTFDPKQSEPSNALHLFPENPPSSSADTHTLSLL